MKTPPKTPLLNKPETPLGNFKTPLGGANTPVQETLIHTTGIDMGRAKSAKFLAIYTVLVAVR